MSPKRTLLALVLTLALVAGACGSDDGDDDATITLNQGSDDDSDSGDGDGAGGDSGSDDDGGDSGSDGDEAPPAPSGSLQSVWPLPDGDHQVFVAYQLIDDEFQYAESASFQTTDLTMDDVLEFYRDYFPTIGLATNEIELGESIAMNLTNPDDSSWSGVMQVGPDPDGSVIINQNYSDLKEAGDDGDAGDSGADSSGSSSGASDGASEGG